MFRDHGSGRDRLQVPGGGKAWTGLSEVAILMDGSSLSEPYLGQASTFDLDEDRQPHVAKCPGGSRQPWQLDMRSSDMIIY